MADYSVIVDDFHGGILYGPNADSWSLSYHPDAYQGTVHQALSSDANLTLPFVGGREIFIRGNFVGDNNASVSTTYPVFQVDSLYFLECFPQPPQNDGQFFCSVDLPLTITNRTLSMFENPNAEIQQFHIDYIRYGSSSHIAATRNKTVVFVQAPDNNTSGLSFDTHWRYQPIGGTDDNQNAMRTSTPSAKATYNFVGQSIAWWACCLPASTSSNAANVTYSIDGGNAVPVQVDQYFIQGDQCEEEKLLFQIHSLTSQLNDGNHTLEVVYNGDHTKMPITLCGLASTPSDFSALDVKPVGYLSNPSSTLSPSPTPSPSLPTGQTHDGQGIHPKSHIGIISGIVCGIVIALTVMSVGVIWWRRKRASQQRRESRSSEINSLYPFAFHPVVGFVDMEKQNSTILDPPPVSVMVSTGVSTEPATADEQEGNSEMQPGSTDTRSESSQLESRPPSYRTTRGSLPNL